MSSGANSSLSAAEKFYGSKICLISKAEIRYEGTLYCLNLREATISLAKVRSFGTEDRPTERPVPAKDECYEFIIFRGPDIKSIDVLEPPRSMSTMPCGLPLDPAIVDVMQRPLGNHGSVDHAVRLASSRAGNGYANPADADGLFEGLLRGGNNNNRGRNQGRRSSGDRGRRNSGRNNNGNYQGGSNGNWRGNNQVDNNGGRSRQDGNNRNGNNGGNGNASRARRGSSHRNQGRNGGGDRDGRAGGGRSGSRQRNGRSQERQQQPRQPRGVIEAQLPPKVTFEDPFDFEKSNEEMKNAMEKLKLEEKEKTATENGIDTEDSAEETKKEDPVIYYDKDKFFDNISCEALERAQRREPRPDWFDERKLNSETFGLPLRHNNYRNNNRGRYGRADYGNGRGDYGNGRGGGGFYRNGNNRNFNNNRSYNNRYRNNWNNGGGNRDRDRGQSNNN